MTAAPRLPLPPRPLSGGSASAPDGADSPDGGDVDARLRDWRAEVVATIPSRLALLAGAWLLVAPFVLDYTTTGTGFRAYWNDVLVGLAVIIVSAPRIAAPDRTAALTPVAAVLGGWLAAAPFVLSLGGTAAGGGVPEAVVNDVLVGVLLVVLAGLSAAGHRSLVARRSRRNSPSG